MAMNFTTIRNTNQETIIHFETVTNESASIDISTLAADTQTRNSDTPKVNIVRFISTGVDGSAVIVSRNGKNIIACAPENAPILDLTQYGISDAQQNDQNILIAQSVASKPVSGYITLRKIQGWSTKVETVVYGAYDDETRVGASTTKSGSPDAPGAHS
jgi:hypothetical protein